MRIQSQPPLHLTYCLNVHPGERWDENLAAIRGAAESVHQRVAPGRPFGLGLRLGGQAAGELSQPGRIEELKQYLDDHHLYVFTINGFPWGQFHDEHVKDHVYKPDWRTRERLTYTLQLADHLARLLPDGVTGSISTLPGAYRPALKFEGDTGAIVNRMLDAVHHLHGIHLREGKLIQLAVEPEPGCAIETTDEFILFVTRRLLPAADTRGISEEAVLRHFGLCLDTCHAAIQFEDLIASIEKCREEGIQIAKIQLSAALKTDGSASAAAALRPFAEPIYLHQVRARTRDGAFASWVDLENALREWPDRDDLEEARIHFHVPLFWPGSDTLRTTADALTPEFFDTVRTGATEHLEIETYTYGVLPPELRPADVVDGISREFHWVMERVRA